MVRTGLILCVLPDAGCAPSMPGTYDLFVSLVPGTGGSYTCTTRNQLPFRKDLPVVVRGSGEKKSGPSVIRVWYSRLSPVVNAGRSPSQWRVRAGFSPASLLRPNATCAACYSIVGNISWADDGRVKATSLRHSPSVTCSPRGLRVKST
jgi:hypothetical protein